MKTKYNLFIFYLFSFILLSFNNNLLYAASSIYSGLNISNVKTSFESCGGEKIDFKASKGIFIGLNISNNMSIECSFDTLKNKIYCIDSTQYKIYAPQVSSNMILLFPIKSKIQLVNTTGVSLIRPKYTNCSSNTVLYNSTNAMFTVGFGIQNKTNRPITSRFIVKGYIPMGNKSDRLIKKIITMNFDISYCFNYL